MHVARTFLSRTYTPTHVLRNPSNLIDVSRVSRFSLLGPLVALALVAISTSASAQQPLFESRGVWFATVLGDGNWPVSALDSAEKQAADLRNRIQHAHSLGLNTFVFQAVARGDAMYESSRLPWSARLRAAAVHPGYDPLQVAIDEAHRLGMELHAWINVNRIGDLSTVEQFESASNPGHVYYESPGWVQNLSGALWLDPSFPEARQWLVDNTMEIVENYDVDAVHFDFLRYPSGGLPDDGASYQFDNRGFDNIADWRRDNITQFVRDVSAAIWENHPWVVVGSAPFGNYENFDGAWPAAWALTDVFQESRKWLTEGIQDYVAPQIYFGIGRTPEGTNTYDSPDFTYLVNEWVDESSNRPVFVGHGPYKSVVLAELDTQVDVTREAEAAGQYYFRYDHIKSFDFSTAYPSRALPAPMRHRFEAAAPTVPQLISAETETDDQENTTVTLEWSPSVGSAADPLRGYAIFSSNSGIPFTGGGETLVASVWGTENTYSGPEPAAGSSYQVVAISRLGSISAPSNILTGVPVGVETLANDIRLELETIYPNPASNRLSVAYQIGTSTEFDIRVFDIVGREVMSQQARPATTGLNTFQLDIRDLPTGLYAIVLQTPTDQISETFVVSR